MNKWSKVGAFNDGLTALTKSSFKPFGSGYACVMYSLAINTKDVDTVYGYGITTEGWSQMHRSSYALSRVFEIIHEGRDSFGFD